MVGRLSRNLEKPCVRHKQAALRVLRYLKATIRLQLQYRSSGNRELICYTDADFAADTATRRSTMGFACILAGAAISWCSKKQESVSLSTTEVEYAALCYGTKEVLWLQLLLSEIGEPCKGPTTLYGDNQSALALMQNPQFHARTKHINVQLHFTREQEKRGAITTQYIATEEMVADCLTKPLRNELLAQQREKIGLHHALAKGKC